jgi:hypothetical protein
MEVYMFKNVTILSIVLLFSFSLFAQDLPEQVNPVLKSLSNSTKLVNITNEGMTKNHASSFKSGGDITPLVLNGPIISGNGTSGNARAPIGTFRYERVVYLITAAEMSAAGVPSSINFNQIAWIYSTAGNIACTGTCNIYFQNTSDVANTKSTTWSTTGMTQVNSGAFTVPAAGYVIKTLSAPTAFTYSGGGLYIAFEWSFPSGTLSTGTVVSCNTNLTNGLLGAQSNTALPTTVAASSFRPETYLGYAWTNDAGVLQVYSLGKLPIPYATPHVVRAAIGNQGDDTLYSKVVTLNVTGANTFTTTTTIDTMLPGYYYDIAFSAFTPTNVGYDTITVSLPTDATLSNNSKKVTQLVTYNSYTFAYGPFPASSDGGVGFNGGTGDFVAKFSTSSATSVNQVSVNFTTSGIPFKIGIWADSSIGGPGTLLWESAALTTTTGVYTLLVNPKVNVSGIFYVGVRQTGTTNVGFAYQAEDPIRSDYFYYTAPTGSTTWSDFAVTSSPFRFMIEPRLTLANDVGISTINNPVGGTTYHLNNYPFTPQATVANFGSSNQGSFNVTMKIYDAALSQVYTSTKTVASLNAGNTSIVNFDATAFTPTAQAYTAKCFTSLGTDADMTNDTVSAAFNYSYWTLQLGALFEAMWVSGGETAMTMAPTVTVELHDSTTLSLFESKTAILSTAGFATLNFITPLNDSPYYVVVKSANTVETWSATPQRFTSSALSYDFAIGVAQAYTDGSNPPLVLHGSLYCIYSGDVNQDGFITGDDFQDVDNDAANFDYHVATDVNGDGFVTGDDFQFIDNNAALFVQRQIPPGAPGHLVKHNVQHKSSVN